MKKFIWLNLRFVSIGLILILVPLAIYSYKKQLTINDIPAPKFSNSYSLNEKISFLSNKSKDVKILSIGSSMTLNNLSSKEVISFFENESYINASSWGLNISEISNLFHTIYDTSTPDVLIICSNIMDFTSSDKVINYKLIKDFLNSKLTLIKYHYEAYPFNYFFDNWSYAKLVRNDSRNYHYLGFDKNGGVALNSKNFQINQQRWNNNIINNLKIDTNQYDELRKLSSYCKVNNIQLIFFQNPIRNGIFSKLNKEEIKILSNHALKVKEIMNTDKHIFVNSNEKSWDDDLFLDSSHLSKIGSDLFTEYCFDKVVELTE